MKFSKPKAKSKLEKIFLEGVDKDTPDIVKNRKLLDLNNINKFEFVLKKENLKEFSDDGKGLGILSWFENYRKEAKVSTAGIRGLQNPIYPWDTRYAMNLLGITLATLGKIMVSKEIPGSKKKISACETRYNSKEFVELIARIQAAYGIETLVTDDYEPIPIFLISFLVFMYDLYGGEYVTSSHAMAKKIATKDLNTQGSQYIPTESLKFVAKVEEILKEVQVKGQYKIDFSDSSNKLINKTFLKRVGNGIKMYSDYLKKGVATNNNLKLIKSNKNKITVDCMGGSMYKTLRPILNNLNILKSYKFFHTSEDPFQHKVGKVIKNNGEFFDWGCDTTIMQVDLKKLTIKAPVIETLGYRKLLKNYPIGSVILVTDPDADRLITTYIDSSENIDKIKKRGLVYYSLDKDRVLVMFTPNQSFLMNVDFQKKSLEKAGLWGKYDWFILKTTASQRSWDEWAHANKVPVVNTPVGFKELQDIMIHTEKKILKGDKDIYVKDIFGKSIHLGKNPRLLFAGEESGGEIFGPSELIKSKGGRMAISMREKSAGEAILIASALASWLNSNNINMSDYLWDIYKENKIKALYEIRLDNKYYNESEPDINKLKRDKEKGIGIRTKNDMYFLSIALAYRDKIIDLDIVKKILSECFNDLDFKDLIDIKFVGDGTYMKFSEKTLEVRPSGTDAINKAYCYGKDQWECIKYAQDFSAYIGKRTPLHEKYINEKYYQNIKSYAFDIYTKYKEYLRNI